jgi:hypothetical protein
LSFLFSSGKKVRSGRGVGVIFDQHIPDDDGWFSGRGCQGGDRATDLSRT